MHLLFWLQSTLNMAWNSVSSNISKKHKTQYSVHHISEQNLEEIQSNKYLLQIPQQQQIPVIKVNSEQRRDSVLQITSTKGIKCGFWSWNSYSAESMKGDYYICCVTMEYVFVWKGSKHFIRVGANDQNCASSTF